METLINPGSFFSWTTDIDYRAMRQVSFEDASYWNRTKKTKKQHFLTEMDAVLPWDAMLDLIRPFYYKGGKGRPPIGLATMLRIYFLQQWYGYSDPGMEDALYDNVSVRVFAHVEACTRPMRRPSASFAIYWSSTG